jgi:hypothetical protein
MPKTMKDYSGAKHSNAHVTPTERNTVSSIEAFNTEKNVKGKSSFYWTKPKEGLREVVIPMDNIYIQCVFRAFNKFLIEEAQGQAFTTGRLKSDIEKAMDLFRAEKEEIIAGDRLLFGSWKPEDCVLIFKTT